MEENYYVNYKGTIGDFIREHRKARKISSRELSKLIGQSSSYISAIENGRNQNPSYDNLYKIFKVIGIKDTMIESYLESFGFYDPNKLEQDLQQAIKQRNMSDEEYEVLRKRELESYVNSPDIIENGGNELIKEILQFELKDINLILSKIAFDKENNGFNLVRNLGKVLTLSQKDKNLYRFLIRFFDSELPNLSEKSMVKVINTLYEEINNSEEIKSWGEYTIKQPINKI